MGQPRGLVPCQECSSAAFAESKSTAVIPLTTNGRKYPESGLHYSNSHATSSKECATMIDNLCRLMTSCKEHNSKTWLGTARNVEDAKSDLCKIFTAWYDGKEVDQDLKPRFLYGNWEDDEDRAFWEGITTIPLPESCMVLCADGDIPDSAVKEKVRVRLTQAHGNPNLLAALEALMMPSPPDHA